MQGLVGEVRLLACRRSCRTLRVSSKARTVRTRPPSQLSCTNGAGQVDQVGVADPQPGGVLDAGRRCTGRASAGSPCTAMARSTSTSTACWPWRGQRQLLLGALAARSVHSHRPISSVARRADANASSRRSSGNRAATWSPMASARACRATPSASAVLAERRRPARAVPVVPGIGEEWGCHPLRYRHRRSPT